MDAKLLATIIAVAKKEASANSVDVSNLQRTVEDQLQEFHKRSPILETPTFSVINGCLQCHWQSGLKMNLGDIVGPKGDKGDSIKGDKGDSVKGDKGDSIKGDKGDSIKGDKGDSVKGDKGDFIKGDKGDSVKGDKGEPGVDGDSIKGDKGDPGRNALPAIPAEDGIDGLDGVGVDKAYVNDNHHLTIKLTSGKVIDAGYVRGPSGASSGKGGRVTGGYSGGSASIPGPAGKDGTDGQSADTVVYVTQASQLSGDLDSTKAYVVDGQVDMGNQSIVVPPGGLNILGTTLNTSLLFSTANNYTMFIYDDNTYAGSLSLSLMAFKVNGTGSQVFNLDNKENTGRISWQSLNFNECTSLGTFANYNQALAQNIGFVSCTDGFTVSGTWGGGWAILNSILLGTPFPGTLFRAGANLSIGGSFRSNINILELDVDNGTFCDFAPSNIVLDAGFTLSNVRVNPLANPTPNMPATSIKALIRDCVGLANTYPGASVSPDSDSVITVSEQDTLYQITGSVTIADACWFSVGNTNGLKSNSSLGLEVKCSGIFSFSGSSGVELGVQFRKFNYASSTYSSIGPEYNTTIFGTVFPLASNVSFTASTTLQKDDRIEVWVKNRDNTDNITLKSGGQFEVTER